MAWKKVIFSGSSAELSALTVDGTVTANTLSGDGSSLTNVSADSVAFTAITGKPTLVSSSAQVDFNSILNTSNIVSSSTQVDFTDIQNTSNILSSSTQVDFNSITNTSNIVSSSTQINYTEVSSVPAGIVSSSTQIQNIINNNNVLPDGTVSSSAQVSYPDISNKPVGIVSASDQINFNNITGKPGGLVSQSSQIDYSSVTNVPTGIISSSTQIDTIFNLDGVHSSSAQVVAALDNQVVTGLENVSSSYVRVESGSNNFDLLLEDGLNLAFKAVDTQSMYLKGAEGLLGSSNNFYFSGSLRSQHLGAQGEFVTVGPNKELRSSNSVTSALPAGVVSGSAAQARTQIGVDAAGTDNSTDVTLAGSPDYITISGQVITRNQLDLTADVTGELPNANVANLPASKITNFATEVADNLPTGVVSSSAQFNSFDTALTGSFTGSFAGDGSGLTGVEAEVVETATVEHNFTGVSSTVVTHNFETRNVIVAVYIGNEIVYPETIETNSDNQVTVTFATPRTGRVVVAKGGHLVSGSVSSITGGSTGNPVAVWSSENTLTNFSALSFNGSTLALTGNMTVTGNVDGRDVSADGTKLDGIEASADVTDTTNVVAALTAGTNVTIAGDGTISSTNTNTQLTDAEVVSALSNQDVNLGTGNITGSSFLFTNGTITNGLNVQGNATFSNASFSGDISSVNNITVSGNVDGRDVSVDGANLDSLLAATGSFLTAHPNIAAATSVDNSGRTYIQDITLDGNGHITGITSATETITNTNTFRTVTAGGNTLGASETLAFTAGTNVTITETGGAVTITSTDTNDDVSVANLKTRLAGGFGSNAVSIGDNTDTVTIPGNLTVQGTQTINNVNLINTSNGVIFEGTTDDNFETTLTATDPTADRAINLPDAGGTVALTSDITGTNSGTNTGDQNIFSTVAVSGQTSIAADTTSDTLTLAAGSNVTITTNAGTDTVTISSTDTNTNTFRTVTAGGNTLGASETLAFTAGTNVTITETGGAVTIASTDTNTQLSTEAVQDIVGAMFTGNTETRIAATYQDGDGTIDLVATDQSYTLPLATNTVRGGIELFSNTDQSVAANAVTTTAGRTYGIQLNSANQAVVNVPWSDTNTDTNTFRTVTAGGNTLGSSETLAFTAGTNITITETGGAVTINSTDTNTQATRDSLGIDTNDNVAFEGLIVGQTTGATANTIRCTGDIVAYYSSDKQFKDNIKPLEGALDKVKQIRGVEFDWNDKQDVYEGHDIGVVAQEVEAVYPDLVHYREHSDSKAVDYVKLNAVLIEAVKELSAKVEALEAKL